MSDRKPVIISEEQLEEQRQYIQQIRLMPDAPKSYHVCLLYTSPSPRDRG